MYIKVLLRALSVLAVLVLLGGNLVAAAAPPAPAQASPEPTPAAPDAAGQSQAATCGGAVTASADSYVNQLTPETNYGSARTLAIGQTGAVELRTLLAFPISQLLATGVTVAHAEIQLALAGAPTPLPFLMEAHEITGTWTETGVRWSNQPPLGAGYGAVSYNAADNQVSIDVTSLANHWFSDAISPTVSVALVPITATTQVLAYSRDGAGGDVTLAPRLVIECNATQEEQGADQTARDQRQLAGIARLKQVSQTPLKIDVQGGAVNFADFQLPLSPAAGQTPPERARWFLRTYSDTLRLASPNQDMQLMRNSRDGQHVFFRQVRNGIPVFGAVMGVHFGGEVVRNVQGQYIPDLALPSTPRLTARQAEDLAMVLALGDGSVRLGDGSVRLRDGTVQTLLQGATQLRYVNPALLGRSDRRTHLAWQVNLLGKTAPVTVFIDALTGQTVMKQTQATHEFELRYLYTVDHDTSGACWIFTDTEEWFDEHGKVSGAGPDAEGYTAYNSIRDTYNYWRNRFGRDSYDDDGEEVEAYMHVGSSWRNANYTGGTCDIFQFGDGFVANDIIGHEFTHAVDNSEGGLEYENQSGALDESFADIFGYFRDPTDWTMGEDSPLGALRDMSNPPKYGDPDHMLASKSGDGKGLRKLPDGVDPECDNTDPKYNDCGYVHTNSSIQNKAAYLIIQGGDHTGHHVVGIGKTKAERLFYDVLTNWMWDDAQLIDARNAAVAESFLLYTQAKFTLADICSVKNAYAAVGLGSGDADCDGIDDAAETDNDNDGVKDSKDNCMYIANSGQGDVDHDGLGDVCDPDIDGDAKLNPADNCAYVNNPNQANVDGDAKGDACDDSDNDTIVDAKDNCRLTANPDQKDTDGDGMGNECDTDWDNDGHTNPADNCPLKYNPNQADADHDAIGDACDLCPAISSGDNGDPDGDGKANPCDTDDDNDGVPDTSDNCPLVANANQFDLNGNGIGTVCDPQDQATLGKIKSKVYIDWITRIPLPTCAQCGAYTPGGLETFVNVAAPVGFQARIVDTNGREVAKGKSLTGGNVSLKFSPPAVAGQGSAGAAASAQQARVTADDAVEYYLQILGAPGAAGQVDVDAEISQGPRGGLYLPLLQR